MWLRVLGAVLLLVAAGCDDEREEHLPEQAQRDADSECYRQLEARFAKLSAGNETSARMQLALDEARKQLGKRIAACAAHLDASADATGRRCAELLRILLEENLGETRDAAIIRKLRGLAAGDDPPAVLAGLLAWQLARDAFVSMARLAPDDPDRVAAARIALMGMYDKIPSASKFEADLSRALEQTVVAGRPVLLKEFEAATPEEKARLIAREVSLRSAVHLLRIARDHPDSVWTPAIHRAWQSFGEHHPDEAAAARAFLENP